MSFWQNVRSRLASWKLSPPAPDTSAPRESGEERGARWTRLGLRTSLLLCALAVIAYAGSQWTGPSWDPLLQTIGLSLLLAGSSFLVGALFGFLFGIPKTLQQNAPSTPPEEPAPSGAQEAEEGKTLRQRQRIEYRGNTSLEQISDWLTKILIGISLTQWNDIRRDFQRLVAYTADGFGATPSHEVFAGGIIVLSAICGFFAGYLLTRLFLPLALTKSDLEGSRMYESRQEADRQVESLRSIPPRGVAKAIAESAPGVQRQIREQLAALARDYENLRSTMPSGSDRTRKMETVMSQMRTMASMVDPALREELQSSSSPGERLAAIACLQVHPDRTALAWLADRVGSEKPFVGYHAALALLYATRAGAAPQNELLSIIQRAKGLLEPEDRGSDRAQVLGEAERQTSWMS